MYNIGMDHVATLLKAEGDLDTYPTSFRASSPRGYRLNGDWLNT